MFQHDRGTGGLLLIVRCKLRIECLLILQHHHVEHCNYTRSDENSLVAEDFENITV